jgi:hypothetical protein
VRAFVSREMVAAAIPPYRDCGCTIQQRTARYLDASLAEVVPFYRLATCWHFSQPTLRDQHSRPKGPAPARRNRAT